MTVSSANARWDYTSGAAQTAFPYDSKIFAGSDLKVYVNGVLKTLTTDYSVTNVGVDTGGNVVFNAGLTGGDKVALVKDVPATQLSALGAAGKLPSGAIENALDKVTVIAQSVVEKIRRALAFPEGDAATLSSTLPASAARAAKFLAFDAQGQPIAAAGTSANLGPVSGFINTLLDDVDAETARGTLGFLSTDAGAGEGPSVALFRDSASPAVSDLLGALLFDGRSATGVRRSHAKLMAQVLDPTNTSEDAELLLQTIVAGALATRAVLGQGLRLGSAFGGDKGAGSLNLAALYQHGVLALPAGQLWGFTLSNNGSDPTNDIDIASGQAIDSTNTRMIERGGTLTKRLDAAWAVGTNQGGLDTGAIANDTYHVYAIMRSDTGVSDVLFSVSASAPTMPTNYDFRRRIGSIVRASGAILTFSQLGDEFRLKAQRLELAETGGSWATGSRTLRTLAGVPAGIQVAPLVGVHSRNGTTGNLHWLITSPDDTDEAPSTSAAPGFTIRLSTSTTVDDTSPPPLRTNTSRQIGTRPNAVGGAADELKIMCRGWIDRRGRDA
jgi:hypothetical protein